MSRRSGLSARHSRRSRCANLIKDSSLLSIIAISEFTLNAQEVNTSTLNAFESFFPLAIGYLLLTLPIFYLSRQLEKQLYFDS